MLLIFESFLFNKVNFLKKEIFSLLYTYIVIIALELVSLISGKLKKILLIERFFFLEDIWSRSYKNQLRR